MLEQWVEMLKFTPGIKPFLKSSRLFKKENFHELDYRKGLKK